MPELPETETIARDLHTHVRLRSIESVAVLRPDVLRGVSPASLGRRLRGARIERSWRRAKAVVVEFSTGDRLVVVPRFTGALTVAQGRSGTPDAAYAAVRFTLRGGGTLTYSDVRRLGTVTLLDPTAFDQFDRRLGVEPLGAEFTVERLAAVLCGSRQPVKKVLMEQHRIAGVGNIYANEALWTAAIDPSRASHSIASNAVTKLHDAVVSVLQAAIEARGTTFRDYRDGQGRPGAYAQQLAVYGRAGMPCRRCGTRLASTHAIDGRSTVFCFRCQG